MHLIVRTYDSNEASQEMKEKMLHWLIEHLGGHAFARYNSGFREMVLQHISFPYDAMSIAITGVESDKNWWLSRYSYTNWGENGKLRGHYGVAVSVPDEITGVTMMLSI